MTRTIPKRRVSVVTIVILIVVFVSSTSFAGWKIEESLDSITGKIYQSAYILSENGSKFILKRKKNGKVWGYLQLPKKSQFEENESLILQVDKNESREEDDQLQKKFNIPSYEWEKTIIGFLLWHGHLDEGCGFIYQLLNGKKMVIRYRENHQFQKEIIFDISKNKEAILEVLCLKSEQCKEERSLDGISKGIMQGLENYRKSLIPQRFDAETRNNIMMLPPYAQWIRSMDGFEASLKKTLNKIVTCRSSYNEEACNSWKSYKDQSLLWLKLIEDQCVYLPKDSLSLYKNGHMDQIRRINKFRAEIKNEEMIIKNIK